MSLTPRQAAAKARVEAAGGVFISPQQYKAMKLSQNGGKKKSVTTRPRYKSGQIIRVRVV